MEQVPSWLLELALRVLPPRPVALPAALLRARSRKVPPPVLLGTFVAGHVVAPCGEEKAMKRLWTQEELVEHWILTPDELALLGNKTGALCGGGRHHAADLTAQATPLPADVAEEAGH